MKRLLEELRPKQWYKQSVIFIPLLFSRNLTNLDAILLTFAATVSFSLIASSIYVLNDIIDIEEDRNHPRKKHRPIASGDVSVRLGVLTSIVLSILSLSLGYAIGIPFMLLLMLYFVQNIFYSYTLKHIAFVDVLMISFGFVIRAVSGAVAIGEPVSSWLITSVGFLALLLGVGKRKNEIEETDDSSTREVLKVYEKAGIDRIITINITTLISVYALYTFTYDNNVIIATIPLVVFALLRYTYLVQIKDIGSKPYKLLFDTQSVVNILIWTALVFMALYRPHYLESLIEF